MTKYYSITKLYSVTKYYYMTNDYPTGIVDVLLKTPPTKTLYISVLNYYWYYYYYYYNYYY